MATKSKEPVRLRRRLQEGTGRTSLYLDIYIDGRRSYEYLHLYLIPEKSRSDKEENRKTLALAEAIRAKRVVEVQNGEFGFRNQFREETNFYDYYTHLCEERLGEESRGIGGIGAAVGSTCCSMTRSSGSALSGTSRPST